MTFEASVAGFKFSLPEPRWTECWSALAMILWSAYVFFMPEHLGQRAPYTMLGGIATDQQWSSIGIALGIAQWAMATMNWRLCRAMMCSVGMTFWTFLFTGISLDANESFPGVALYFSNAIMNFGSLLCLLAILLLQKGGNAR